MTGDSWVPRPENLPMLHGKLIKRPFLRPSPSHCSDGAVFQPFSKGSDAANKLECRLIYILEGLI